ncbi:MAG: hypothetical protein ACU837_14150 [Gammaproteobacteria bacterium]
MATKDQYNSPDIAVLGSKVYVAWKLLSGHYQGSKMLMFRRSTDKGATFEPFI